MGSFSYIGPDVAGVAAEHRKNQQELANEKRKVTLKTLLEDAETPADKVAAIQAVYHQDPGVLKQHVENLTRRLTGKKAQPVVSPADAQAQRLAPIAARGKTPEQQQLATYGTKLGMQQDADLSGTQKLMKYRASLSPEDQKNFDAIMGISQHQGSIKSIPGSAGQPYKNAQGQWVRAIENPDGTTGEQAMPPGWQPKPPLPQLKQINGHDVLFDTTTQKVIKDFGPHGSVRVTRHETPITDADGNVHIETLTSISTPGGGSIQVDAGDSGDEQPSKPSTKQPAPKKSASTPTHAGGRTLPFQKGTPAFNKVQGEYAEAVKLASIADQVAQRPNDAINQKRLAVALERTSAGRFTTQALDYIIKAGWGNTIEQWANNPTTGALPTDVMRQLIDGAHQNLKAAKDAVDAVRIPAPQGSARKVGDTKTFPNGKKGVWDGHGWVAQ